MSLGGRLDSSSRWHTQLNYIHETRDGQRLLGSNFITTSSQLPGPVEFVTDQLDSLPAGELRAPCGALRPGELVVAMLEGWRGEIAHAVATGM